MVVDRLGMVVFSNSIQNAFFARYTHALMTVPSKYAWIPFRLIPETCVRMSPMAFKSSSALNDVRIYLLFIGEYYFNYLCLEHELEILSMVHKCNSHRLVSKMEKQNSPISRSFLAYRYTARYLGDNCLVY